MFSMGSHAPKAYDARGILTGTPMGGTMSIADLRKNYTYGGLVETDIHPDPIDQFTLWFEQARQVSGNEPNAMTVATADADGQPAARMVLLKGFDARGFLFYTNYESEKGQEIAENPKAAILFYWPELERQVRISGVMVKTTREESENYFHSRPRGSQIGAAASRQSAVIANREALEAAFAAFEAEYQDREVPMPENWGGYRLVPDWLEFWQGRPSRLHDRLRYLREADGTWQVVRLSP
jgi:pyridoxamine 5'-phosphate oxidase